MDSEEIRRHWTNWANTYGSALRATTKTWTAKALELDALSRRIRSILGENADGHLLEMGCGNGINCIELAKAFTRMRCDGVDFIPEMVSAATANGRRSEVEDRVRFFVGDAVGVESVLGLKPVYSAVLTDRCLINLNTLELQKRAISALAAKVQPGGYLLMIENSLTTYRDQNHCREILGLKSRTPAAFNFFFEEAEIQPHIAR